MTGSSFLNAFKVLWKKPAVLLLLFPIHAFAPMLLLLLPMMNDLDDRGAATVFLSVVLFGILFTLLYLVVRAIFLISPAMELLRDGAAGQETPRGWYLRGLKKHWWKRGTLGCAEYSISMFLSFIAQFLMMIPMTLIMIPSMESASSGNIGTMVAMIVVLYGIMFLVYIVLALVMYCMETLSAYLLAALADRDFAASFMAVFSKAGMRKYYKLLGGRFLIMLLSSLLVTFLAFGGVFITILGQGALSLGDLDNDWLDGSIDYKYQRPFEADPFDSLDDMDGILPLALISTACLLLYSILEIYRFAYEFCVFQEYKNEEHAATGPLPEPNQESTPSGAGA